MKASRFSAYTLPALAIAVLLSISCATPSGPGVVMYTPPSVPQSPAQRRAGFDPNANANAVVAGFNASARARAMREDAALRSAELEMRQARAQQRLSTDDWVASVSGLSGRSSTPASATLIANDGTFLGDCNGEFGAQSIANEFSPYGSEYAKASMFNTYGDYGSKYSDKSPMNTYAEPARLYFDGSFVCYVSTSTLRIPSIDPHVLRALAKKN